MRLIYFILFICLLMNACIAPAKSPSSIKQKIEQNWQTFIKSWENEDANGCAALYSEDAINIPPANTIKNGKKEIEEFYQMLFDSNLSSKYSHTIDSIYYTSPIQIVERSHFTVDWTRNDSTEWTYNARSFALWEYEKGHWKIKSFIFNNPPSE